MTTPRRWSVRVGRVAGIDIRLHASMLLLVWLVVASASQTHTGLGAGFLWITAIFVSVLVHEFSHSITARRFGVVVREIELLPIGGISKFDAIPQNPHQELTIALAGPLASLVIGLVTLAAVTVGRGGIPAPALSGGAFWTRLAWFNVVVAVFNLLPALPLDGGRVLKAIFEMREGPLLATHHAARLARVVAFGMIAFGLFTGEIFVAIIGIFVSVVSRVEEMSAELEAQLARLLVSDVMVHSPLVVSDRQTVGEVTWMLHESSQRQFPVLDDAGAVLGVVAARRLAYADRETRLGTLAERRPTVRAAMRLDECGPLDAGTALPVLDAAGRVIGLLYADDVVLAARRSDMPAHRKLAA
ncbi:MAG TPA: site-2 protease family protein [Acidimicrobiales bacterium]|nr:site-2 protease family protein [Acidimicrobiales bacterium]